MFKPAVGPLLLLFALSMGAGCASPVNLEDRPCPCGTGFNCCATTKTCLPVGDMCPAPPAAPSPMAWVHSPLVRQGGTVMVTLSGSDGTPPTTDRGFTVRPIPGVPSSYDVDIRHGEPLGDVEVSFVTTDKTVHRTRALFSVCEITVGPRGSDRGRGTSDEPFRTFQQAARVAERGDTIFLLDSGLGGYSVGTELRSTSVRDGVTIQGATSQTLLITSLEFAGSAVLKSVSINPRAYVTGAGSVVQLDNVKAQAGLEVDAAAVGARVELIGRTVLTNIDHPATLVVKAADVAVKLSGGAAIINSTPPGAENVRDAEAVRIEGRNAVLRVDDTSTLSSPGNNALTDLGGTTATFHSAVVSGVLSFIHPESVVDVTKSTFHMSATGSSGIIFRGRTLKVMDSNFIGMGVSQESPGSLAVVHGCNFTNFSEPAYVLYAGTLDLGTMEESGRNMFMGRPTRMGVLPMALSVLAKPGVGSATVSGTSFNGWVPPPSAVMGPARTPEYEISEKVPINFY